MSTARSPIRVLFLISQLESGGAERQLLHLLRRIDCDRFQTRVLPTYSGGVFWDSFTKLPSTTIEALGGAETKMSHRLRRAIKLTREFRPNVIYSFEQGPNLLGLILSRLTGARLIWGVRNTPSASTSSTGRMKLYTILNRRLSRTPNRIVYNSERGRRMYEDLGFPKNRSLVIPNGFDEEAFFRDQAGRAHMRREWNVSDNEILVGLVGSFKPQKNHALFLQAAAEVRERVANVRFVLVGTEYPDHPFLGPYAAKCHEIADELRLGDQLIWGGEHTDMRSVYSAMDILALTSTNEGMPNVIAEAALCETLCVSTDVGDAAELLADSRMLAPSLELPSVVGCLETALNLSSEERMRLAHSGRQHILNRYSMKAMVTSTEGVLEKLAGVS